MTELPSAWVLCAIGDVLAPVKMTGKDEPDREIWYVDISSIDNQTNRITDPKRLQFSEAPSRARQKIAGGDVLFSTVRPYLRKIAAVESKYDGEIASTGFAVLRGATGIDPKYLLFKAISHDFVSALTGEQYGVSYPAVKEEQVKAQPLELPPTNEQRRIVEKIEAMFDEIAAGIQSLQTARATLGLYRQSLLKSAFEGRLTADWRAQNADNLEAPESLLARIQKERDTRYKAALDVWQDALAAWRADGEKGKKPAKPKRPADLDPKAGITLGHVILDVAQGWSPKCENHASRAVDIWGVIKTTAIQPAKFLSHENKELPDDLVPREWLELSLGDVLITRAGPRARVGVACMVKSTRPRLMLCDKAYRLNYLDALVLPEFLEAYLNAPDTQRRIEVIKSGINDSGLNLKQEQFLALDFWLPSIAEQAEIVRRLDARLEAANALEAEIDAALTRARALRQSILKKAFSGHLVPQDPEDEPASALLERIKAERAMASKAPRKRKVTA